MKNTIITVLIFILSFCIGVVAFMYYMNSEKDNTVYSVPDSTLPVILMQKEGFTYNPLFGINTPVDIKTGNDSLSIVGEDRKLEFQLLNLGNNVKSLSVEVRSIGDNSLIEKQTLDIPEEFEALPFEYLLKDLYTPGERYQLNIKISTDLFTDVLYSTTLVYGIDVKFAEKVKFVNDFHHALFNENTANSITKYLETSSSLKKNNTFYYTNIHSSFSNITYGGLGVKQYDDAYLTICDISEDSATIKMEYLLFTNEAQNIVFYRAEEVYNIRSSKDEMYLIDYERYMDEIPDTSKIVDAGKINLGLCDAGEEVKKSHENNVYAFVSGGSLYSYDVKKNELSEIFSDFNYMNPDIRALNSDRRVRVLKVFDDGSVNFLVYGYIKRGFHEGDRGILIYSYDSSKNDIEQVAFIPYTKNFDIMDAGMRKVVYQNGAGEIYFYLDSSVYKINPATTEITEFAATGYLDESMVNEDQNIIIWADADNEDGAINISDLEASDTVKIIAEEGEKIFPLGFFGSDIILGYARNEDIEKGKHEDNQILMYKLCIINSDGEILKKYEPENIYITGIEKSDARIDIRRVSRDSKGKLTKASDDLIVDASPEAEKESIKTLFEDQIKKDIFYIELPKEAGTKIAKIMSPKHVAFESENVLTIPESDRYSYYVYAKGGAVGVYLDSAEAVKIAGEVRGYVIDSEGDIIWQKKSRALRNQIIAITENEVTEDESSLAVCLNVMMEYEGIVRSAQYLLDHGKSAEEILGENMEAYKVINLTGCEIDSLLYYLNDDYPVLAAVDSGEYVLITGYNETNLVLMEPSTGKLYKKAIQDCNKLFNNNGRVFITYKE